MEKEKWTSEADMKNDAVDIRFASRTHRRLITSLVTNATGRSVERIIEDENNGEQQPADDRVERARHLEAFLKLLEYLNLAEATSRGWKLTHSMLEIIARNATDRQKLTRHPLNAKDQFILNMLFKGAWPGVDPLDSDEEEDFACRILHALGFIKAHHSSSGFTEDNGVLKPIIDGWKPTAVLCHVLENRKK